MAPQPARVTGGQAGHPNGTRGHPEDDDSARPELPPRPPASCSTLEQLLPLEASLLHELLQTIEGVAADVEGFLLAPMLVVHDQDRAVVRNEVDPQPNIRVSVAPAQDELPHVGQLVEASSGARSDFALEMPRPLLLEALLPHQLVDLCSVEAAEVQALLLLPVLVKEYEVRVMMGDEIDLEPRVSVSVAGFFDEAPDFRQLVEASS